MTVCKDGAIGPLTLMEVVETVLEEIINLLSDYEDAVYIQAPVGLRDFRSRADQKELSGARTATKD